MNFNKNKKESSGLKYDKNLETNSIDYTKYSDNENEKIESENEIENSSSKNGRVENSKNQNNYYNEKTNKYIEKYGQIINCEMLNIRRKPYPNAEIIGTFKKNDIIKIIGEEREFYKVSVDNGDAYSMKKYIEIY